MAKNKQPRRPIEIRRRCSCGLLHREIPKTARYSDDPMMAGWYWECSCFSTLYYPHGKTGWQAAAERGFKRFEALKAQAAALLKRRGA